MAGRQRYPAREVAEAVRASRGLVTLAARRLGCERHTVTNYANRHPTVAAALEEARELQLDVTEAKLFQQIEAGELAAITFYLRTVGRHRGYGDKSEISLDARVDVRAEIQQTIDVLMVALEHYPAARFAAAAALLRAGGQGEGLNNAKSLPAHGVNGHSNGHADDRG